MPPQTMGVPFLEWWLGAASRADLYVHDKWISHALSQHDQGLIRCLLRLGCRVFVFACMRFKDIEAIDDGEKFHWLGHGSEQ